MANEQANNMKTLVFVHAHTNLPFYISSSPLLMQVAWMELEPVAQQWKLDKDAGKDVIPWDATLYAKRSRGTP